MDEAQFKELSERLDNIVRLLALNLVKDMEVQQDKITALSSFGFENPQIAEMLGTTQGTVRVALSRARRRQQRNR